MCGTYTGVGVGVGPPAGGYSRFTRLTVRHRSTSTFFRATHKTFVLVFEAVTPTNTNNDAPGSSLAGWLR